MTEMQAASTTESTPATVTEAAPAVASSSESSNIPSTQAAAPAAATSSEAVPASEPVKVEGATETPALAENVLGDIVKTDKPVAEEKKIDDKATPDIKPSEKAAEVKVELPVYEFKLPENIAVDQEPLTNFNKLLGEIETGKLDHLGLQEKGQALVDMHIKGVQDSLERQTDFYVEQHKKTGNDWLQAFKKDPELGGDNLQETVSNLQHTVASYAGNEAQIKEFRDLMLTTNAGNHPALIRLIKNMSDKIAKYESEPKNGMVPAARPAPTKVKDHQIFYSKMG